MLQTILASALSTVFTIMPWVSPAVHAQAPQVQMTVNDVGFSPSTVTAIVNQPIHLRIVNRGTKTHQLSIPYYYVFTENLKVGQVSTVSFTPSTPGQFDMTSDPTGTNNPEFKGKLIVTDQK